MAVPDEVLSRVGEAKNLDGLSDDDLKAVLKEYYDRCVQWGQKLSKKAKKKAKTCFAQYPSWGLRIRKHLLGEILKILMEDF